MVQSEVAAKLRHYLEGGLDALSDFLWQEFQRDIDLSHRIVESLDHTLSVFRKLLHPND